VPLCCVSCCAAALHAPPSTRPHPVSFGDPLGLHATPPPLRRVPSPGSSTAAVAALLPLFAAPATSSAAASFDLSQGVLDPASFQPVCPASDGFYRFGQTLVVGLVGADSYKEYAPLIAGGLLRVRLELCVVESFFYEAIIPFVKENGLSWVLPLHETVETFLAGVVFAVATNFILLGSTKIITVLATYADIFFGFPFRIVGGVGWRSLEDNALEALKQAAPEEKPRPWWKGKKPRPEVPLDEVYAANSATVADKAALATWGSLLAVGQVSKGARQTIEAVDLFVGRYLLFTTVTYVLIKFVHFKLFDPFPM